MPRTRLSEEQSERWVDIMVLTHDMLDAARSEQWTRLSELEVERWKQLSVVFAPPPSEQDAREIASCISELLSLDGMILDRLCRARDAASADLLSLRRGREAQGAYGSELSRHLGGL